MFYLHYPEACGYQNKEGGDLWWGNSAHKIICKNGHVRFREKLKTLFLHFHNVCDRKTWQCGNVSWEPAPMKSYDSLIIWFCEITWQTKNVISPLPPCLGFILPFKHVVAWIHVTNWKHYIFTITMLMITKFNRVEAYLDEIPPVKSYYALSCGSVRSYEKSKTLSLLNLLEDTNSTRNYLLVAFIWFLFVIYLVKSTYL